MEIAEEVSLDSSPGTMQEEVDQMDIIEAYEMMNGMCKDERVKELNFWRMNVKTPDICP